MPERIAIIPARGGSKRLPDKNIRSFCGQPMIGYALQAAHASGLFSCIHVSTESDRIMAVVASLGHAVAFPRPVELADDHTPLMPVLKHVLEAWQERGRHFDQVCLLNPCSPLVEAADLRGAAALQDANPTLSVLGVTPFPVPIEWAYLLGEGGRLTPAQPGMFKVRSQDLGKKYHEAGSFTFFPARRILEIRGAGRDDDFLGYPMPRVKSVDIDDADDWAMAEALYLGRQLQAAGKHL
ncbi:MAG: acylneuraminate cytidylyltransferase family protein [Magnetococcales bacterium]|nr:acylneuraminate cytidylyltransferase family protein [Magnetococcales bacterium]